MFIELTTNKEEKITVNTQHILYIFPSRKGTTVVDVNGIDCTVSETYESLKAVLETKTF